MNKNLMSLVIGGMIGAALTYTKTTPNAVEKVQHGCKNAVDSLENRLEKMD
ncbi:MAG: hypothetical protein ACK5HL_04485 [Bacilli bacterium]